MTHRIELFVNDSKNWAFFEPLLNMTNRVEVFFSLTQRVQLFLCSNMTQRIEPFLSLIPRVEPLFLEIWLKELNLFKWLTELKLFLWLIELNLFFEYDSKNWFFEHDSKELNLPLLVWLKELNLFFLHGSQNWTSLFRIMTHRIELLFMTHRIEPLFEYDSKNWISFWVWLKESNFFWSEKDSQNWTLLFTHRNEHLFSIWREEMNLSCFPTWLKELNFFDWLKKKNWTGFLEYDSKNWERILSKMTRRIELFFSIRLNELNLFLEYDPQNWTFFQYDWKNSELFKNYDSLNWTFLQKKMTQRMFWKVKNVSKNWFFEYNSQNWTLFFDMTYRIEPIFSTWLIEFFFYKNFDSQKWLILSGKMTQRIEPFFEYDSKNRTQKKNQKFELFSKKKMTQRIEPSLNVTQKVEFFECD